MHFMQVKNTHQFNMIIYPNATGTASGQGHWNLYKLVSITEELNGGNYVPIKQV